MAAGIVFHNITTSSGVTFSIACWVPDTTAPDVGAIPVSLPVSSGGVVADPTTFAKESGGNLAAIVTALATNHTDEVQLHTDIATTLIAKNEAIRALLAGTLTMSVADGSSIALGAKADAAVTDPTASGSLIALFKGLLKTVGTLATNYGQTSSRVVSSATANTATNLKASAGNITQIDLFNVAAYDVFVKFYNKASAPTVGTDTPAWTVPIKAGTGYSRAFPQGKWFATGISYGISKLQADTDSTALLASDVTGSIDWI